MEGGGGRNFGPLREVGPSWELILDLAEHYRVFISCLHKFLLYSLNECFRSISTRLSKAPVICLAAADGCKYCMYNKINYNNFLEVHLYAHIIIG